MPNSSPITGATCSVFDCDFVKKNEIPWRRRKVPVRIKSASGALIPKAGEAFTCDCSAVVKDHVVPFTTEVFTLEEGIDLILGMDWLRANTISLTWEVKDELMFHPGVGVSVNTEESVT